MTKEEQRSAAYQYAVERQKDPNYPVYNWETEIEEAYIEGFQQGRNDAVEAAIEFIYQRQAVDIEVPYIEKFIGDFKKYMYMEEQQ